MTDDEEQTFEVVLNHEEQYSIWPADRPPPAGWRTVGFAGPRQACIDHIDVVWTDMRPLSLRRAMGAVDPPVVDSSGAPGVPASTSEP